MRAIAPFGGGGDERTDLAPQCAGEMHHGCLHRDDEVERTDERRCFVVIVDGLLPLLHANTGALERLELAFRIGILKTHEIDARNGEYRKPLS